MSPVIAEKKLSTRPVELGAHQRARQSKRHPDCRSTTIKLAVTQISLALSSRRDNHHPAATAEMAILIVAVFPSRLSRYNIIQFTVTKEQGVYAADGVNVPVVTDGSTFEEQANIREA